MGVAADRPTAELLVLAHGDSAGEVLRARLEERAMSTAAGKPDRGALAASLGPATSFATTEHFNLQTARALTVTEANGRASIYLAALSSILIVLAFIGQISRLGIAFYAFALILLPVLAFVGMVTFLRLVQSSIEDLAYARSDRTPAQLLPAGLAGARAVLRHRPGHALIRAS